MWENMKFKEPVSKRKRMLPEGRVPQGQSCGKGRGEDTP